MHISLTSKRLSPCLNCIWFRYNKDDELRKGADIGYCSNSKSFWYLQYTTCKCKLKEFKEEEEL